MYSVGDMVVYGRMGVCRVDDIGTPHLSAADVDRSYYTLSPIYKDGRIYVPVDTCGFMRPVISRDEALSLIERMPDIEGAIFESRQVSAVREHYQTLLVSDDWTDVIQVIKSIYAKRQALAEIGKCLGQVEAQYMKRAEEMLYEEFAVALGIPKNDVQAYILEAVARVEHGEVL